MKKLLLALLFLTLPVQAQTVGIINGATPAFGGTTGQCITQGADQTTSFVDCAAGIPVCIGTTITATGATGYVIAPGVRAVYVTLWGAGGGGGSGRRGLIASARSGGVGGAGSIPVTRTMLAAELTSPVTVTVGAGGAGGIAQTVDSTGGNVGTSGGNTTFGTYLRAVGGLGGPGGTAGNTSASDGYSPVVNYGGLFISQNTSVTGTFSSTGALNAWPNGGGAGAPGGSLSVANAEFLGSVAPFSASADPALTAPTTQALAGAVGAAGASSTLPGIAGYGGGGGGPSAAATGGAGGTGGRGSGGGGGGASANGQNSGAGGLGGNGMAYIVACF